MAQATIPSPQPSPAPPRRSSSLRGREQRTSVALAVALYDVVRHTRRTHAADPVEPAAAVVLASADRLAPARPSDVACELRLDLSTVSRHVKALEDGGLLRRTEDPDDRRARRIEPTADGERVLQQVIENRAATLDEALHSWSADDRALLVTMLQRLSRDLEAAR